MEIVVLLVLALVVLAFGIRVGMLLAPRVERLADRANRVDPAADASVEATPDPALEAHDEEDD